MHQANIQCSWLHQRKPSVVFFLIATPEAPFDLKVLDTTWESVHLQWTAGFDGGYIQQFKLQYQETDDKGSGMQEKPDEAINVTWYNVTGKAGVFSH